MMKELNSQSLLKQLYAEYGQKLIDNQINRIDDWLEHWTERTSSIDYSKPHLTIIKGAVEGTSDWVLEDSVLYVILKKGYKIGKSKTHGYCANLKFKDSVRTDFQELKESGLGCYFYEDFLRLSCGNIR